MAYNNRTENKEMSDYISESEIETMNERDALKADQQKLLFERSGLEKDCERWKGECSKLEKECRNWKDVAVRAVEARKAVEKELVMLIGVATERDDWRASSEKWQTECSVLEDGGVRLVGKCGDVELQRDSWKAEAERWRAVAERCGYAEQWRDHYKGEAERWYKAVCGLEKTVTELRERVEIADEYIAELEKEKEPQPTTEDFARVAEECGNVDMDRLCARKSVVTKKDPAFQKILDELFAECNAEVRKAEACVDQLELTQGPEQLEYVVRQDGVCGKESRKGKPRWQKHGEAPVYQDVAPSVDMVNHPPHYKKGSVECIDAIQAALSDEEFRGFCKGNAMKYVYRERHKGGSEDLKKAVWYLNREI